MYFDSYATGKRIQQLRKANGMTQEQFAIELNTSDRHIRRIERGEETPSIDLYVEMVATFNTSLDYLLLGKAPSEREEQLKRQLYAKLHRIARNLDEIAEGFFYEKIHFSLFESRKYHFIVSTIYFSQNRT